MAHPGSVVSTLAPKGVAGLAIALLVLATLFGVLNGKKMKMLEATLASAQAARDTAERRARNQANSQGADSTETTARAALAEAENRVKKAEADLAQLQKEKADLEATVETQRQEIASLRKSADDAEKNPNAAGTANPAAAEGTAQLQAQIDDLRRQLDSAEKEKTLLSEKLQDAQEHPSQPRETRKRRETTASRRVGVRGTVLATNQAYNFVVLNLGARQGVEPNSEMLVLRDGTLIGKIRISSVEPTTAIGDIITSSLARGVQVQPGDNVIYAGTNP